MIIIMFEGNDIGSRDLRSRDFYWEIIIRVWRIENEGFI